MKYGNIYATRGIADAMDQSPKFAAEVRQAFGRYQQGDWGDVCEEDRAQNDEAARNGERVLASYQTSGGKIWIITEWDRSATTILYPDEY